MKHNKPINAKEKEPDGSFLNRQFYYPLKLVIVY